MKNMGMIIENKKNIKYSGFIVVNTIVLFLGLYRKYIGSEELYIFTDIGSDTYYAYLPLYYEMIDKINNHDFSLFNLYNGLGNSIMAGVGSNVHIELPFLFILCLVGKEKIYFGILLCIFLKILIMEIIVFYYFCELDISKEIAVLGALLWGFCGYNLLWGQHYFFLTFMLEFSIFLLIIEKILNNKSRKWWGWLSILSGICSINNFYTLYSCLATIGVYFFVRLFYLKNTFSKIIEMCVKYILSCFLGIGIFLFISAEWIICMLESARKLNIEFTSKFDINLKEVCNLLGRFISSESFGVRNFTGLDNLYESPMLSSSILSIPAFYWLCKRDRKKIILLIIIFISCFSSITKKIFMLLSSNRWYYFYTFLSIVAITYMLNDIFTNHMQLKLKDIIWVIGGTIVLLIILYLGNIYAAVQYNLKAIAIRIFLLLDYLILLVFYNNDNNKKTSYFLLIILATIEILVGNYELINNRTSIDKEEYNLLTSGETIKLINSIKEMDKNSLYRIRAYNYRSYLNHSAIGKYYSTNSYSSLNKKYSIEFISNLQEADSAYAISRDPNHFDISCENYAIQTLLGVKYIISNEPPEGYIMYLEGNNVNAYYNVNTIPMGFVYSNSNRISKTDYMTLSPLQKRLVLYDMYYLNEDLDNIENKNMKLEISTATPKEVTFEDDRIKGINNTAIHIERESTGKACEMIIQMVSPSTGLYMKVYYAEKDEEFSEEKTVFRYLIQGSRTYSLYFEDEYVEKIKIIPILSDGDETYNFEIERIAFVDWTEKYDVLYNNKAKNLLDRCALTVSFYDDIYQAYVWNQEEGILFIPLSYSINWTATVNGERAKVHRINDAFCGISLPKGSCKVIMQYKTFGERIWICNSMVSFVIWNSIFNQGMVNFITRKKKNKNSI